MPAPRESEVLVESLCSLISIGTELKCLRGRFEPSSHWAQWVRYPFLPGYSSVARVVAAGDRVTEVSVGDRVTCDGPHCQRYVWPSDRVVRVPSEVPDEAAAWSSLAVTVQSAMRRSEQRLGDSVVVVGAGSVGQLLVQYSRLLGARHVMVVSRDSERLRAAMKHGATDGILGEAKRATAVILEITNGRGADIVYDASGDPRVLPDALRAVRRFGTVVLLGDPTHPQRQRLSGAMMTRGIKILAAHALDVATYESTHVRWASREMRLLFLDYVRRGDMCFAQLVNRRVSPTAAREVYAGLLDRGTSLTGIVFDWSRLT